MWRWSATAIPSSGGREAAVYLARIPSRCSIRTGLATKSSMPTWARPGLTDIHAPQAVI